MQRIRRQEGSHWNARWNMWEGSLMILASCQRACWLKTRARVLTGRPIILEHNDAVHCSLFLLWKLREWNQQVIDRVMTFEEGIVKSHHDECADSKGINFPEEVQLLMTPSERFSKMVPRYLYSSTTSTGFSRTVVVTAAARSLCLEKVTTISFVFFTFSSSVWLLMKCWNKVRNTLPAQCLRTRPLMLAGPEELLSPRLQP